MRQSSGGSVADNHGSNPYFDPLKHPWIVAVLYAFPGGIFMGLLAVTIGRQTIRESIETAVMNMFLLFLLFGCVNWLRARKR
ncbi:hypothetical protein NITHO_4570008 [Nitrolancea hollandica Lb]|uniref:Uncharacterized protein n=1 Tax=Nitrolancea hollandica Lb TaxID=1129897 RepID=I4EKE4_9BACT|nr:hypothetical protein NITHO_4570008 [Nitrolancea hollandica Lb]